MFCHLLHYCTYGISFYCTAVVTIVSVFFTFSGHLNSFKHLILYIAFISTHSDFFNDDQFISKTHQVEFI